MRFGFTLPYIYMSCAACLRWDRRRLRCFHNEWKCECQLSATPFFVTGIARRITTVVPSLFSMRSRGCGPKGLQLVIVTFGLTILVLGQCCCARLVQGLEHGDSKTVPVVDQNIEAVFSGERGAFASYQGRRRDAGEIVHNSNSYDTMPREL